MSKTKIATDEQIAELQAELSDYNDAMHTKLTLEVLAECNVALTWDAASKPGKAARKIVSNYLSEEAARYAHEAAECAAEDRVERHGENDGYNERSEQWRRR